MFYSINTWKLSIEYTNEHVISYLCNTSKRNIIQTNFVELRDNKDFYLKIHVHRPLYCEYDIS